MGSPAQPTAGTRRTISTINCKSLASGDGRALEIGGGDGCPGLSQGALVIKNPPANAGDMRHGFDPWVRKMPWRRK